MSSHKNNGSRDPRAAQGSTPGPHSGPIWSQVNPILRFVRLHFGSIPRQFGSIRTNSDQFGAILDQRATWYSNVVFWFPTWYFGFQRGIVVFQRGILVSNVVFWFPMWYFGFQRGILLAREYFPPVQIHFPTLYFAFHRLKIFLNRCRKTS